MRANLLGLMITLGVTGCATDGVPDELAGETDNEEAGKGDGDGAFSYWRVELAGDGYRVSRPNRTVNECGAGVRGAKCDVTSLDLAPTAMPSSVAKGYADRLRAGETLLLRGELGPERSELAYERLSRTAGPAIASTDLVPALPPSAPSIHTGDDNGPDCLYARLFVQDVDVSGAEITVSPTAAGTLAFRARFSGVSIPSKSEHAVSCVNGTSAITVKATTLTAAGVMTVAENGTIAFVDMTYQLEGVAYDSALPPPAPILDMLFSNPAAIGNIVTSSVGLALAPLVKDSKNGRALLTTEVWQPGSTEAGDLSGVFVLATQDADGILERRLNSTRSATIDELDLAASGATADVVERATAALAAGDEVLLVGYRYKDGDTRGRSANQFWTKAPVPLH